jgi:hypothetical protein
MRDSDGGRVACSTRAAAAPLIFLLAACNGNPEAPTRTGVPMVFVTCNRFGTDPLGCEARVSCSLGPCAPGTPRDVTQAAVWTPGDSSVVMVIGPGLIQAVGTGDTFVQAAWQTGYSAVQPVSVFPGMPPLPTFEIFGSVYQKGQTPASGAINGAVVEILNGSIAGRSAISGVPPPLLPGYGGPIGGPGFYRLIGLPPGTYRLHITKEGYASQERVVVLTGSGSASVQFELEAG